MMMYGDVTTYVSVAGFQANELERRIGYGHGRLSRGYEVYELAQLVSVGDFSWGDQTRYSGAWQHLRDIDEYAQRIDLFREALAKQSNYDDGIVDGKLQAFLEREAAKLNVRGGPNRIVKLRPSIRHDDSAPWSVQYPNAPMGGIPQWTILKTHQRLFRKIADVPSGGIFR